MRSKQRNTPFSIIRSLWLWESLILCLFLHTPTVSKTLGKAHVTETSINILRWRSLGPSLFSGRISDIAIPKGQSNIVYCAAASGGIWKTENNGTTWKPIFDDQGTGSMGALAVADSNPNIIWAGTGEAIAANHSTWGDGIYKSTDAGKTWKHMGLRESQQIGKIVIDPEDTNVLYVAAVGHLWGKNLERGLYKTTDGGRRWIKSLFISDKVGVVDVVMEPEDNKTLYAASYGRIRGRYSRSETEELKILKGGGIYKTADAGETWVKLNKGLPSQRVGRIGLAISSSNPNRIYALVERAPFEIQLSPDELESIKKLLALDIEPEPAEVRRIKEYIERKTPTDEKAAFVVKDLSRFEQAQLRTVLGLEEIDTGGGVFRSDDKGQTWQRMNKMSMLRRASYYSRIYVHPHNEDRVYIPEVRMWISQDGGKTFNLAGWAFSSWLTSRFIHGDFHPFWINSENPNHLIVGTDGGLYSSYDGGKNWGAHHMPIGQFHAITIDMRKPYYIYGGMEDNGGWAGPSATRHISGISDYDWFKYEHSDGAYVQVDPTDNMTVYTEWQNGNISRLDLRTGMRTSIKPRTQEEELPLRFNFITPFLLSSHDPQTLYIGAQRVLKTQDRGDTWTSISPDLTKGGEIATISTIAESPLVAGLLIVGTEDGNVQISRDDGTSWTNVADCIPGLPKEEYGRANICVSRVEACHFDPGTFYVSFDGHRDDDFGVYIYGTKDYGKTWESIKGDLPEGFVVRVIREDYKNPNLLFIGTAIGVYVSIDEGQHWIPLKNGLPPVRVDDMVIHPRDGDLIIGTHGRGIYVMDILPLQELIPEVMEKDIHLFKVQPAILFHLDITKNKGVRGARWFAATNPYAELLDLMTARYVLGVNSALAPPGVTIYYYLKNTSQEPIEITILDHKGEEVIRRLRGSAEEGLNKVIWDLRESALPLSRIDGGNDAVRLQERGLNEMPGPLVKPGKYMIRISAEGKQLEQIMVVEPDTILNKIT